MKFPLPNLTLDPKEGKANNNDFFFILLFVSYSNKEDDLEDARAAAQKKVSVPTTVQIFEYLFWGNLSK